MVQFCLRPSIMEYKGLLLSITTDKGGYSSSEVAEEEVWCSNLAKMATLFFRTCMKYKGRLGSLSVVKATDLRDRYYEIKPWSSRLGVVQWVITCPSCKNFKYLQYQKNPPIHL